MPIFKVFFYKGLKKIFFYKKKIITIKLIEHMIFYQLNNLHKRDYLKFDDWLQNEEVRSILHKTN